MLNRLKMPWSLQRILFVALGTLIVIQAIVERQWFGIFFGAYFLFMGVFAFGCCGGSCGIPQKRNFDTNEVEFEEVK